MKRTVFLVAATGLALSGCGGLSSILNGGGSTGTAPQNAVRANVAGDTFTYVIGGSYTISGVVSNISSGSATDTWTSDTFNNVAALQDALTIVAQLPSGQQTTVDDRQFSSAFATLGQTDNGTMYNVSAGGFTLPTTLAAGNSVNGVETLSDGTTVTLAYNVTGYATPVVTAGSFPCWTITKTLTWSDGLTQSINENFSPALGAVVQETIINTFTSGLTSTVTLSLSSYTLG